MAPCQQIWAQSPRKRAGYLTTLAEMGNQDGPGYEVQRSVALLSQHETTRSRQIRTKERHRMWLAGRLLRLTPAFLVPQIIALLCRSLLWTETGIVKEFTSSYSGKVFILFILQGKTCLRQSPVIPTQRTKSPVSFLQGKPPFRLKHHHQSISCRMYLLLFSALRVSWSKAQLSPNRSKARKNETENHVEPRQKPSSVVKKKPGSTQSQMLRVSKRGNYEEADERMRIRAMMAPLQLLGVQWKLNTRFAKCVTRVSPQGSVRVNSGRFTQSFSWAGSTQGNRPVDFSYVSQICMNIVSTIKH